MQGHLFLTDSDGPEGFTAFGNENHVYCARPCHVEEFGGVDGNVPVCSSLPADRKYVCAARFCPGRDYLVEGEKRRQPSK